MKVKTEMGNKDKLEEFVAMVEKVALAWSELEQCGFENETMASELMQALEPFETYQEHVLFQHVLFQSTIINQMLDDDLPEQSKVWKKSALELAHIIGPEHAQNFYKFAVLVTKLA
jgi:hypothetical protein